MIKGKYVATVEVDFEIDENDPSLKPFDKIRDEVRNDLTPNIQGLLQEELEDIGKVTVSQMYADVHRAGVGRRRRNMKIVRVIVPGNTVHLVARIFAHDEKARRYVTNCEAITMSEIEQGATTIDLTYREPIKLPWEEEKE